MLKTLKQTIKLNQQPQSLINLPKISLYSPQALLSSNSSLKPFDILISAFKFNFSDSMITIFVCFFNMVITLGVPFANNYIIQQISPETSCCFSSVIIIVGQILALKLIKVGFLLSSDMFQLMTGVKYYGYFVSKVMSSYLKNKEVSGKAINHIQDDSERMLNIPYSFINLMFLTTQIIVSGFSITYIIDSSRSFLIPISILTFLVLCGLMGYRSYQINKQMMKSKDTRLDSNFNGNMIMEKRMQEIGKVNQYLRFNLGIKLLGLISYGVLFFIVFWLQESQLTGNKKYLLVMILGLLKSRVERVIFVFCLFMQIYNSLKRTYKGTQRQSLDSQEIASQNQQSKKNLKKIDEISSQKGQIQLKKLYQSIKPCLNKCNLVAFILSLLVTASINTFLLQASKVILSTPTQLIYFLPLFLQLLSISLLFLTLQTITISISKFISQSMSNAVDSYEIINRFSGDIRALDRSVCLNGFDFIMVVLSISASIAYTIFSVSVYWWLSIVFGLAMGFIIYITIKINRYFMNSRRIVMRQQCKIKSKLIESLQNPQMFQGALQKVHGYKMLGIKIELLFLLLVLSLSIVSTIMVIVLCILLNLQHSTTVLLVFAFMQLDSDIVNLFISAIRFEIALISVQRCVNAQKKIKQTEDYSIN